MTEEAADGPTVGIATSNWVPLPDVAERWGLGISQVRQLVKERQLLAVRRAPGTPLVVPAEFLGPRGPVKGLAGTLTLLRDAGYSEPEALRWLFTADDSLPGSPIAALVANRGTEVKRRAQAAGF